MTHTTLTLIAALTMAGTSALAEGHDARIRSFIVNPHGEVDGILLSDRDTVRFSEMTGRSVARQLRVGDRVQVSRDGQTLLSVRNGWSIDLGMGSFGRGGGPSFAPPMSRADRASDGMTVSGGHTGVQQFNVRGIVAGLTYTRGHQIDGFVLNGGITVRVAAASAGNLTGLRPGQTVSVAGTGMRGTKGIGIAADTVRDARGQTVVGAT